MKENLKIKILELLDEGKFKEAEEIAKGSLELEEFYKEQTTLKETLKSFRIRRTPDNLNEKILEKLFEEKENTKDFGIPLLDSLLRIFSFPKISFSVALSILIIILGLAIYSIKPVSENISYYTYKAKSKVEFYLDKIDSAKDLFVFMIDTKREEVIKDLIKKETKKKNEEVKKWQIKTEKSRRELPYFYHLFLG